MIRTNIVLPEDLKKQLQSIAKNEKKSFSQVVREAGIKYVAVKNGKTKQHKKNPFGTFIGSIKDVKISTKPDGSDLSEKIDELIYGPSSN